MLALIKHKDKIFIVDDGQRNFCVSNPLAMAQQTSITAKREMDTACKSCITNSVLLTKSQ